MKKNEPVENEPVEAELATPDDIRKNTAEILFRLSGKDLLRRAVCNKCGARLWSVGDYGECNKPECPNCHDKNEVYWCW